MKRIQLLLSTIASRINSNRVVSSIIFVLCLTLGLYLVFSPFFPEFVFWTQSWTESESFSESTTYLRDNLEAQSLLEEDVPDNWLVIPAIGLDVEIVEGESDEALDYGAWRRPNSGTPIVGGNTVITGHRFKYLPPNNLTFYHLDKLVKGDEIIVYWEGVKYLYKVEDKFEVSSDAIEIENNTQDDQLTLYTCTPLWTAARRLVIIAKPQEL